MKPDPKKFLGEVQQAERAYTIAAIKYHHVERKQRIYPYNDHYKASFEQYQQAKRSLLQALDNRIDHLYLVLAKHEKKVHRFKLHLKQFPNKQGSRDLIKMVNYNSNLANTIAHLKKRKGEINHAQ